jgi:hypothetical protein
MTYKSLVVGIALPLFCADAKPESEITNIMQVKTDIKFLLILQAPLEMIFTILY